MYLGEVTNAGDGKGATKESVALWSDIRDGNSARLLTFLPCDEPRRAVAREVVPPPLNEHQYTIRELDQVHDVYEEPHQPSNKARELEASNMSDRQ